MGLFSKKNETQKNEPEKKTTAEKTSDDSKKGHSNTSYFVSPHPDGGWQVKKANAKKALKRFDTKAEAEDYAKKVAKNQGTSVVRQKKDGKIQKKKRGGVPLGSAIGHFVAVEDLVPEPYCLLGVLLVHDLDGETSMDYGPFPDGRVDHRDVGLAGDPAEVHVSHVAVDTDDLSRYCKTHSITPK